MAVRVALGASPRQLIKQLMAESLALSAAGATLGLAAAAAALPLIVRLMPVDIPRLNEASVDIRALALGLAVVTVTTIFFGLLPAVVLLKRSMTSDLKSGERGSSRGARRMYSVLVAAEIALACALLVSSVLLVRTVRHMMDTPMGVRAEEVVVTTVQVTPAAVPRGASPRPAWTAVGTTHEAILDAIRRRPGVQFAGASNFLPLEIGWRNPFLLQGQPMPARPDEASQAQLHSVSDGYFEAMGAEIASGRAFTAFDGADASGVVVVNDTFAQRYLPQGRAVGTVIRLSATGIGPLGVNLKASAASAHEGIPFEVVGVVKDVRNVPLGQLVEPAIYTSTRQFPFSEVFIAVRATDRAAALSAIREGLREAAPQVPMAAARTWGERFAARSAEPRLLMSVLVFFGGLAALLAALGVYGLFSWAVALRTRELAIRLTLGARPLAVGGLVLRQSAVLVTVGLVAGIGLVQLAHTALTRVLYGVSPGDIGSTAAAALLLLTAAIGACLPPAIRAMRVDPVEGLRAE